MLVPGKAQGLGSSGRANRGVKRSRGSPWLSQPCWRTRTSLTSPAPAWLCTEEQYTRKVTRRTAARGGGPCQAPALQHLHPDARKLLTPAPTVPSLPRRKRALFSAANSVQAKKSCWAFLWEMKSSLIPDHLSPMKLLKRYNRGVSGAPLNKLRRLRFPGSPRKAGSVLTLLRLLPNFSASCLKRGCWDLSCCSTQPCPGQDTPVGSLLPLRCP